MKKIQLLNNLLLMLIIAVGVFESAAQQVVDDLDSTERRAPLAVQKNLQATRKLIRDKNLSFKIGLTDVSERSLEELTGDIIPPNIAEIAAQQNINAAKILQIDPQDILKVEIINNLAASGAYEIDQYGNFYKKSDKLQSGGKLGMSETEKKSAAIKDAGLTPGEWKQCFADSPSYDFRRGYKVLPIRFQQCGNCWAYAAQAVYEYAFMKKHNHIQLTSVKYNTSEQFLVSKFLLCTSANTVFAQGKATTPAKNSSVRKAIFAVVKKKFSMAKKENVFLVQGIWARVVYDVTEDGATSVNVVLKKTGNVWKIVFDHNNGSSEGDDIDDYIKGVPEKIKNPWGN